MFTKQNFYQNSQKFFIAIFLFFLFAQFIFWLKTENIKPQISIVPQLPSKYSIEALSFGDREFYFRILAMKIQNAGDSFGRFTALKEYDYEKLYQWFKILDSLDDKSIFVPMLATYYFSQTQNIPDVIYIVRYLDEYAARDLGKKWWWLYQAIEIANITLKDKKLALELSYKLSEVKSPDAPVWVRQMPAFFHNQLGEDCAAFMVIKKILDEDELGIRKITPREMEFMRHFIKNRLGKLKQKKFDPRQCQNF
jgi:hypothetical protein